MSEPPWFFISRILVARSRDRGALLGSAGTAWGPFGGTAPVLCRQEKRPPASLHAGLYACAGAPRELRRRKTANQNDEQAFDRRIPHQATAPLRFFQYRDRRSEEHT